MIKRNLGRAGAVVEYGRSSCSEAGLGAMRPRLIPDRRGGACLGECPPAGAEAPASSFISPRQAPPHRPCAASSRRAHQHQHRLGFAPASASASASVSASAIERVTESPPEDEDGVVPLGEIKEEARASARAGGHSPRGTAPSSSGPASAAPESTAPTQQARNKKGRIERPL
jgi:hypothetical protein